METDTVLNQVSVVSLTITAVMAVASFVITRLVSARCSQADKLVLFWIIWDAIIHFCLEGLYVYFSLTGTVEKSNHILSEVWKEYGKADKRWVVYDTNLISMELLTCLGVGSLCVLLAYSIVKDKYYRHFIQMTVCVAELYGGWMTFAPEWLIGSPNLVTSNPLYLWVYLVFFNGLWVVIPGALLLQSWVYIRNVHVPKRIKKPLDSTRAKQK